MLRFHVDGACFYKGEYSERKCWRESEMRRKKEEQNMRSNNRLSASTTQTQFSILHRRRLHLRAEQMKRRLKTEENEEYDGFLRTLEQRETRLSM